MFNYGIECRGKFYPGWTVAPVALDSTLLGVQVTTLSERAISSAACK